MSSKEIQAQIDSKIRIADEMRRQLCFSRNTLSLINTLPTEIMVRIFLQVIAISWKGFVPLITHVCIHWRSIALSTPLLWVSRFPSSQDGIRTFLQRSKNAPLYINMQDGSKGRVIDQWPLFRPLMCRTRELSLQFGSKMLGTPGVHTPFAGIPHHQTYMWHPSLFNRVSYSPQLITDILNNIPACIESLQIMFSVAEHSSRYWAFPLARPYDSNPFPRLRRLYFHNFRFDWRCGIIKDLHVLIIRNDSTDIGLSRENLQMLLDVVEACPRIQHLDLSGQAAEGDLHLMTLRERPLTPLACLHTVTISGSLGAAFLTRFALPVARAVDVCAQIPATAPDDVNVVVMNNISHVLGRCDYPLIELNAMLSKGGSDFADVTYLHVTAVLRTSSSVTNTKLVGSSIINMVPRGGHINFRVFFRRGPNVTPQTVLDRILKTGAPAMKRLGCHFYSCVSPSSLFWTRTFSKIPHLEILSLNKCSFDVFTGALMALEPASCDKCLLASTQRPHVEGLATDDCCSNSKLPLPHLKKLIIREIMESPSSRLLHVSESGQFYCTYDQVKEPVERCISARAKYKCKIQVEGLHES